MLGPSVRAPGGIGHFSRRLSEALAGRAHVADLGFARLYPRWTAAGRQTAPAGPPSDVARFGTSRVIAWRPWTWHRARREIARAAPDLLVIQWWHPFFGPVTRSLARSARRAGARIVCVCHNAQPHERFPFARWLTARALADADLILAMSASVRDAVIDLAPRAQVVTLEHPPNLALRAARAARTSTQPSLLFFGTVRAYKGLDDLLEALPAVRAHIPIRLTVAGGFFGSEQRYRAIVRRLGLEDVVDLRPGYVLDGDVEALFAEADLLVLPYRSASQSGIVALAALTGTPVVATAVGGLPEALGANGVLVPPRDPAALAAGIVRALRAPPAPPDVPGADWEAWADATMGVIATSATAVR